jgi:hypothetical protein
MLGLGTLLKAARGGLGPDEIAELLASVGVQCSFTCVPVGAAPFTALAGAAAKAGAQLVELTGALPTGEGIHALLVLGAKS